MSVSGDSLTGKDQNKRLLRDLHTLISGDNEHSSLIIRGKETQTQSGEHSTQREEH